MTTPKLPEVSERRIEAIFEELGDMEVALDPDPLVYGPKRLNEKTSIARGLLTRCERIYVQVAHDLRLYKRTNSSTQLDFDLQKQDLFANDPDVRSGRSVSDREALATMKLRTEREQIIKTEIAIQDLEAVMTVVKAKRADLRDIQGRIRDQTRLCEQELSLGAHWGSRIPPGVESPNLEAAPKTDRNALQQMQDIMVEEGDEVHLTPEDEMWMESEEDEGIDEADVEALLEEASTPSAAEDDPDDLTQFPVVGYCSVCGDPSYQTPSGSTCGEHGGAEVLKEAPVELGSEPAPATKEPKPTPETQKEPQQDSPQPSFPEDDEIDLGALFDEDDKGEAVKAMPAVTTDDEVDHLFRSLTVAPAPTTKTKKPPPAAVVEDMDSLIDLFGADL